MKRTHNLRKKVNIELDLLKKNKVKEIYTADLAKKFNSTRTQIGCILSEREDMKNKRKYNFDTNTVTYWEFV